MKKFIVLSAIVGLAGLGVGFAYRGDNSPAAATAAPVVETTTTTGPAPAQAATATTARKVTTKATVKATTTTRPASVTVASPTTATTGPGQVLSTTSTTAAPTTTTTQAGPAPTCTVVADNPSVTSAGNQTLRVTSTLPATKTRIEVQYPKFGTNKPNPRQTYTPITDAAGSAVQSFNAVDWSTVPAAVTVQFYGPTGAILSAPVCRTTFVSTQA